MRRLLLLAAGVLAIGASSAHATTIDVTVADDAIADDGRCSLREAVRSANLDAAPFNTPGECAAGNLADTINVPAGTFKLTITGPPDEDAQTGDLDVLGELTIVGMGQGATTIDANHIDRVLDVKLGVVLNLNGLTITGGKAPDGSAGGDVVDPGGLGGNATGGPGNAGERGGGIRSSGALTITDSAIVDNEAGSGGAGGSATGGFGATASFGQRGGNGTGGHGGAGAGGGGIYSAGSLTLVRVRVQGNKAGNGGLGGNAVGGQGGGGISDSGGDGGNAFAGAGGSGGAAGGILQIGVAMAIQQSVIADNTAGAGGAGGTAGNGPGGDGGVGQNFGGFGGDAFGGDGGDGGKAGGLVTGSGGSITGTLLSGNKAGDGGNGGNGTAHAGGQLLSASGTGGGGGDGTGGTGGAGGDGGAVWPDGPTLRNVTLVDNASGSGGNAGAGTGGNGGKGNSGTAGSGGNGSGGDGGSAGAGGAIYTPSSVTVDHATITGNGLGISKPGGTGAGGAKGSNGSGGAAGTGTNGASAVSSQGSAIARVTGTSALQASIIAANTSPACTSGVQGDANISFGDATCPGASADPLLGPLADNGGFTFTQRPGDGSPAIDNAPAQGCPATDQRGALRPGGAACDIGAYERAAPIPLVTQAAPTVTGNVNPNARATTAHFEFGTTSAYGTSTPDIAVPPGIEAAPVSADLTGLAPSTTYHVRLVATNADGTSASPDASFTTGAQGGGTDTTKPVILSASVKPKTFKRRRGTTFRYKLSEAAKVVFTIQRKKGKRYVRATRLRKSSKAGANTRKFKTRKLKPGRYRATLVATDPSGNRSKAKRLTFRIKR